MHANKRISAEKTEQYTIVQEKKLSESWRCHARWRSLDMRDHEHVSPNDNKQRPVAEMCLLSSEAQIHGN